MEQILAVAALWLGLAVLSAIVAYWIHIPIAIAEICAGIIAAAISGHYGMLDALGGNLEWLRFLASSGAILLAFLAGAELEPDIVKDKLGEVTLVGLAAFSAPFVGCAAIAYFILDWTPRASLLTGIALSGTSIAILYSVMYETGVNKTEFGKGILGACFINNIGTLLGLGLIFAPFTYRTIVFLVISIIVLALLPFSSNLITRIYAHRSAAIRVKWVMFILFGLGAMALWAGSEAVLPAYLAGMVLAEFATADTAWIKRLRTLTVGFLTPFYYIRAGTLVSIPAIISAPFIFVILLCGKVFTKIMGIYPVVKIYRNMGKERWYYTLMMSTGLMFGTICALYGLSHNIITKEQYSYLVAAIIGSAIFPTLIANALFMPKHLLHPTEELAASEEGGLGD
ncbi:MAG: cation:proton antiporter [Nitrospinota bacterium]|nr:cation:proton antiporter [Nitrospinota bacterium]